jgi:outer membrane murein-binding lipoprotein Lpp
VLPCLTATAVLLAGVAVAGCNSNSNSPTTGGSPVFPPASTTPLVAPGSPDGGSGSPDGGGSPGGEGNPGNGGTDAGGPTSTCYQWNGLADLNGIAFPLRQMASDEEIYGPGSDAVNSDSMAVATAAMGLNGKWPELPSPYAMEVQNEVMVVASSPGAASPAQLDAAATAATDLAGQISQLCFSNP